MDKLYGLQIESSTACNARCNFCPVGLKKLTRPKGHMSDELFHKLVKEAMEIGVEETLIFKDGEPLLFNRFFEWLDYLSERDLKTAIFTNASLLTREKADRLAQYKNIKFIYCSVHGGDKATYESMMGLNYETTVANVQYLISVAHNFPVTVYMLSTAQTKASEAGFNQLWGSHAFISGAYYNWGGAVENPDPSTEGPQEPCGRILTQLQVLHDGRVALCCQDGDGSVILGDANTEHIQTIWERAQPLRDRHKAYDFAMSLCENCNLNRYK